MSNTLEFEDRVIAALRSISRACDVRSRLLLREYGMTLPQSAALQAVGRFQPVAAGEVAKAIQLGQATTSGILNRLEKRGLVKRSRNNRDRRTVTVELTPAGACAFKSAPSMLHDRFQQAVNGLKDWERTQILAVWQRIVCIIDVEGVEEPSIPASAVGVVTPNDMSCGPSKRVTAPAKGEGALAGALASASRNSSTVNGNGQRQSRKLKPKTSN